MPIFTKDNENTMFKAIRDSMGNIESLKKVLQKYKEEQEGILYGVLNGKKDKLGRTLIARAVHNYKELSTNSMPSPIPGENCFFVAQEGAKRVIECLLEAGSDPKLAKDGYGNALFRYGRGDAKGLYLGEMELSYTCDATCPVTTSKTTTESPSTGTSTAISSSTTENHPTTSSNFTTENLTTSSTTVSLSTSAVLNQTRSSSRVTRSSDITLPEGYVSPNSSIIAKHTSTSTEDVIFQEINNSFFPLLGSAELDAATSGAMGGVFDASFQRALESFDRNNTGSSNAISMLLSSVPMLLGLASDAYFLFLLQNERENQNVQDSEQSTDEILWKIMGLATISSRAALNLGLPFLNYYYNHSSNRSLKVIRESARILPVATTAFNFVTAPVLTGINIASKGLAYGLTRAGLNYFFPSTIKNTSVVQNGDDVEMQTMLSKITSNTSEGKYCLLTDTRFQELCTTVNKINEIFDENPGKTKQKDVRNSIDAINQIIHYEPVTRLWLQKFTTFEALLSAEGFGPSIGHLKQLCDIAYEFSNRLHKLRSERIRSDINLHTQFILTILNEALDRFRGLEGYEKGRKQGIAEGAQHVEEGIKKATVRLPLLDASAKNSNLSNVSRHTIGFFEAQNNRKDSGVGCESNSSERSSAETSTTEEQVPEEMRPMLP